MMFSVDTDNNNLEAQDMRSSDSKKVFSIKTNIIIFSSIFEFLLKNSTKYDCKNYN